jgi:pterin-4a-carbinolamine dehydratase
LGEGPGHRRQLCHRRALVNTLRTTATLTPAQAQQRLKAERVQTRLKRMPSWRMQSGGKAIDRVRQFPDPLTAASYLAFAALLARQSGQPLRATVNGNTIMVALPGRSSKGLTEEVLDLAEQLGVRAARNGDERI